MAAIGFFLEILVWLLPWSIVATRVALSFNEPAARIGGMLGRVWAGLVLAWSWLVTMPLWLETGYVRWLGAVALLSAPAGALLEVLFAARSRLHGRGRLWAMVGVASLAAVLVGAEVTFKLAGSSGGSGVISMTENESVRLGQSESSVEARLGTPSTQQDVGYQDPPPGYECIYYADSGYALQGGTTYRFCFRSGALAFKDGSGGNLDLPTPVQ
jgi:hypothetical protein